MERDKIERYLEKAVIVVLKNGFRYEGKITDADDECTWLFDKFKYMHMIDSTQIADIFTREDVPN